MSVLLSGVHVNLFDPVADYDTGNAVPDHIGIGTCFTHETVDAENQRQSGNRNIAGERKGSSKDNEARASDAGGSLLSAGAPQEGVSCWKSVI